MKPDLTTPNALVWRWQAFDELTAAELYRIMRLRQLVFVVEQNCAYLDLDDADQLAWHLTGWIRSTQTGTPLPAAYARVFAPGVKFAEASIGRVITNPSVRRAGFGKALMTQAVACTLRIAPGAPIRIGAQIHSTLR